MKNSVLIIALSFFSFSIFAQDGGKLDLIYLTDGSFLRGQITDSIEPTGWKIRLLSGTEVIVPPASIHHIRKTRVNQLILPNGKTFRTKGTYYTVQMHFLSGRTASPEFFGYDYRYGLGAHFTMGYQFNHFFSLGGGIGLDATEFLFAPVFLDVRGCFFKKKVSLTYAFNAGYALPIGEWLYNGDDDDFEKISGGAMIYPSIGVMFAGRREANFFMDVGYKFQFYERDYPQFGWWWQSRGHDKIWLKSLAIRFGWVF